MPEDIESSRAEEVVRISDEIAAANARVQALWAEHEQFVSENAPGSAAPGLMAEIGSWESKKRNAEKRLQDFGWPRKPAPEGE